MSRLKNMLKGYCRASVNKNIVCVHPSVIFSQADRFLFILQPKDRPLIFRN